MSPIRRENFQMRAPTMPEHLRNLEKLVPATLSGAGMAVVTIADAVVVKSRRGEDNKGKPKFEDSVVLRYTEFPRRIHWLNKTAVNILLDQFGDDERDWVGQRIPITVQENVNNPSTGDVDDMVWVAPSDQWEELFTKWDELQTQKKARKAPPAKA